MTFETSVTRAVPVGPSIDGDPAPGFVVGELACRPDDRRNRRGRKAPSSARRCVTEPVPVAGAARTCDRSGDDRPDRPGAADQDAAPHRVGEVQFAGPGERTVRRPSRSPPERRRDAFRRRRFPRSSTWASRQPRVAGAARCRRCSCVRRLVGLGAGDTRSPSMPTRPDQAGVTRYRSGNVQVRISSAKN